jgi:hypothetical protein
MKLIFLCVALATVFTGCGQSSNQPRSAAAKQTVRTDSAPIEKRLPKPGQLQSAWWTSSQVTTDSALSPPGNPAYRVVGFAQLERGKAGELSQQFQSKTTGIVVAQERAKRWGQENPGSIFAPIFLPLPGLRL